MTNLTKVCGLSSLDFAGLIEYSSDRLTHLAILSLSKYFRYQTNVGEVYLAILSSSKYFRYLPMLVNFTLLSLSSSKYSDVYQCW